MFLRQCHSITNLNGDLNKVKSTVSHAAWQINSFLMFLKTPMTKTTSFCGNGLEEIIKSSCLLIWVEIVMLFSVLKLTKLLRLQIAIKQKEVDLLLDIKTKKQVNILNWFQPISKENPTHFISKLSTAWLLMFVEDKLSIKLKLCNGSIMERKTKFGSLNKSDFYSI